MTDQNGPSRGRAPSALALMHAVDVRAVDAGAAAAGVSVRALMENAGAGVADAIAQRFSVQPVTVLCGPGANGGDGWVTARRLWRAGWSVRVLASDPQKLSGAAREAADDWAATGGRHEPLPAALPESGLVVDALFGVGLSRPLEGVYAALVGAMAHAPERVIAVDLPSGLDADSGRPVGEVCGRAGLSVTFVRKKPAHVLFPGRSFCGDVVVIDIDAPAEVIEACALNAWENGPCLWSARYPWPAEDAHKHSRGALRVVSGNAGRTGAARLAARAGLRVGAGLVTVLSPRDAMAENAAQLTAVMLQQLSTTETDLSAASALIVGPALGLGEEHAALLAGYLRFDGRPRCVLDADALTHLARWREALRADDVLTPHLGEFRRLFPGLYEGARSKIEAVRCAAADIGAIVLLKGPDTVVAAPDGRAVVNTTGTPFLATAGAGDVLSGLIGGLMVQGMASFEAAAAGAWLHGRAAERLGPGLVAEDIEAQLPRVLNEIAPARLKRAVD